MTNQFISYLLIAMLLAACTNRSSVVEGTLPSDSYHDECVYWVPLKGASSKTVDSTLICKNRFRLVISDHNLNKMGIIRVRPQLRLALQEIIVFAEEGTVKVKFDSISSASGTPLNDVLQIWKDRKRTHDQESYVLRKKRNAKDANVEEIKEEYEKISAVYRDDIFQIVVENKDNEIGKLIFSLNKSLFTPEQISVIENNHQE